MKKIYKRVMIVMIFIGTLLGLCSYCMENSYKEFDIEGIADYNVWNYIDSDELDFARIEDVIIVPEIKEINHGEYIIYISAYSKTEANQIMVKTLYMKEDENILLDYELNQNIFLEKNQENLFEGWIAGGTFSENDIEISDGKELYLIVQVVMSKENEDITEDILFKINVKGYKSLVMPT